ncbi:MAG: hypothetical protein Q9221_004569 [Calogaya cf. arnoldii]
MGDTGFSDSYVAFWTTEKPKILSSPKSGDVTATTVNGVASASKSQPAILKPVASSPAAETEQGLSYNGNARRQQPILGAYAPTRKRSQHDDEVARRKKVKLSSVSVKTVQEISQQDRAWYEQKGKHKPPFVSNKDPFATPKDASQSTAYRVNTNGDRTHEQMYVYSRDYSPAYQYWVGYHDGHERVLVKCSDEEAGFHLRIWFGHERGMGDDIVAYGVPPTQDLGSLPDAFDEAESPSFEQDNRPTNLAATDKTVPRGEHRPEHERPTSDQEQSSEPESFKTSRSTFISEKGEASTPRVPTRTVWKNPGDPELAASRASTPDMSAFVEPLTPPRTSPSREPNQTPGSALFATDIVKLTIQPDHETDYARRMAPATANDLIDQHPFSEQIAPGQVLPNEPGTISNLPNVPIGETQTTSMAEPVSTNAQRPTSRIARLIADFRSRLFSRQDTQSKKEQLARRKRELRRQLILLELNDIDDDEKKIDGGNGV